MPTPLPKPDVVVEAKALGLGNGLLMLLREALEKSSPGTTVAVRSTDPTVVHDLPAWCRVMSHDYLGAETDIATTYYLKKGEFASLLAEGSPDWGVHVELGRNHELLTQDWMVGRVGDVPEEATGATGFSPRGSVVESNSPTFEFAINSREQVWANEVATLYEQATANQWDASHDIPWDKLEPLEEPLERALCQLMTFLTENEYSALYVPAKFVPQINPQFNEVVMFLCTQMVDEARHIEAFTKRALANGGGLQFSAASTQLSLKSLFDQHDFTVASFLLSVLGEGTFLDLLRFIEVHAPEPVTAEICRRARADETRHVHFGMAHVRYFLEQDPNHYQELLEAVRRRAEYMSSVTEVSPRVQEALVVLAAGGLNADRLAEATQQVHTLIDEMHQHRLQRLHKAGFTEAQAAEISQLHTPNFM